MKKVPYRVTDAAPLHVLGRRVQPGETLHADPAEAAYEVALGHLAEPDPAPTGGSEAAGPVEAPGDPDTE